MQSAQVSNWWEKNFLSLLFLVILFTTCLGAYKYRSEIFPITNQTQIGQSYSVSQYVLGDKAVEKIDDNTLYTYAAGAYFKGDDPTTINFEHPPLGKYVFGLSLWLFKRILVLNLVYFALALFFFALLLRRLKFSAVYTLIAVVYLALGSSLDRHLRTALLDTQILIWSLGFFLSLFWQKETWQKYLLVGLTLGGLIATKYFFPIIFLYFGLLAIWAIYHKTWFKAFSSIILAGIIYLAVYWQYFNHGHSLIDFVKFEWFRFRWWTGNRTIPKFIFLQTILLGKFPMWWETSKKYQVESDWNISWPILFIGHLVALFKQKFAIENLVILVFSLGLLFIYLFGSAVYGRYLLQLLPFWLIIIGWAGKNVIKKFSF